MNEELEKLLDDQAPKNQGENTVELESDSSVVGVIFTVLAWLNLIVGVLQILLQGSGHSWYPDMAYYALGFTLIGSSLFLFAVASCLKFLAKISSRIGLIMRALEK
jgi:hypothetical protein